MNDGTKESDSYSGGPRGYSGLFLGLLALAVIAALVGLGWSYHLSGRMTHAEAQLSKAQQQNQKLSSALLRTNAKLRVTSRALGRSLGITQQQLNQRAQDLLNRQQAAAQHFETEQQATRQKINSVSSDVNGVKTDVNGVKTDVGGVKTSLGKTQTQLKATEMQLQRMKGDLGINSGLIATNQKELDYLKHKGDRNYYQFTLFKKRRAPVSTVSLELRKADVKHNRYTLDIWSNDRKIEKKNRDLDEPVQFYTGKNNNYLYELVVNNIRKNEVQGYIATPKDAPVPVKITGN